jgi:hypothetical protein
MDCSLEGAGGGGRGAGGGGRGAGGGGRGAGGLGGQGAGGRGQGAGGVIEGTKPGHGWMPTRCLQARRMGGPAPSSRRGPSLPTRGAPAGVLADSRLGPPMAPPKPRHRPLQGPPARVGPHPPRALASEGVLADVLQHPFGVARGAVKARHEAREEAQVVGLGHAELEGGVGQVLLGDEPAAC